MYSLQYLNIILAKKENESRRLKLLITVLGPLSYYFHIKSLVESEPLVVVVVGGGMGGYYDMPICHNKYQFVNMTLLEMKSTLA